MSEILSFDCDCCKSDTAIDNAFLVCPECYKIIDADFDTDSESCGNKDEIMSECECCGAKVWTYLMQAICTVCMNTITHVRNTNKLFVQDWEGLEG